MNTVTAEPVDPGITLPDPVGGEPGTPTTLPLTAPPAGLSTGAKVGIAVGAMALLAFLGTKAIVAWDPALQGTR